MSVDARLYEVFLTAPNRQDIAVIAESYRRGDHSRLREPQERMSGRLRGAKFERRAVKKACARSRHLHHLVVHHFNWNEVARRQHDGFCAFILPPMLQIAAEFSGRLASLVYDRICAQR